MLGPKPSLEHAGPAIGIIRTAVALLILIHGVWRATQGGVVPFGGWLESQGFPQGVLLAGAVTGYELIAPLFILTRRFVTLACLGHIFILSIGLVMVHLPSGWFVVGAGRNGVEYSVLLIVALAAVAWAHAPLAKR